MKSTFKAGPPDRAVLKERGDDLKRYANVLDEHLEGRHYVACGRLTIAGFFQLASMSTYWRRSEMPLGEFPKVVGWIERLMRIRARANPWPTASSVGEYGAPGRSGRIEPAQEDRNSAEMTDAT